MFNVHKECHKRVSILDKKYLFLEDTFLKEFTKKIFYFIEVIPDSLGKAETSFGLNNEDPPDQPLLNKNSVRSEGKLLFTNKFCHAYTDV